MVSPKSKSDTALLAGTGTSDLRRKPQLQFETWRSLNALDRVISIIDPNNVRSIRVAEKLGMKFCGDVMLDGYDHPDGVYACERKRL